MTDDSAWYVVRKPELLLSPCLLVYPEIIRRNWQEAIRIAGGPQRLRPHVKTHKTPQIVDMALAAGITKHKCATLAEAEMLARCGAPDVLIAYPLVGPAIEQLMELIKSYPQTRFRGVVDNTKSLAWLSAAAVRHGQSLDLLVDIDCGMHRTGIPVGPAASELYRALGRTPGITAGGLHIYDGHNHQSNLEERQAAVQGLLRPIREMISSLQAAGCSIPRLVCGGTPTFPVFASLPDANLECSPGTCALSDYNYGQMYTDMSGIQPAAVLFSRVITRCGDNRLTLDLGYKAVSGDQPAGRRCHILNVPEAKEIGHSEEHLVIESPHASKFQPGDVVYALPAHICPTVALHSHLQVVEAGEIVDAWLVASRDRIYRLAMAHA